VLDSSRDEEIVGELKIDVLSVLVKMPDAVNTLVEELKIGLLSGTFVVK
jgi:hypothetical protein